MLDYYLAHRAYREEQLIAALAAGAGTVDELVAESTPRCPQALWPAAAQSTRATLAKLAAEGRVRLGPTAPVRPA